MIVAKEKIVDGRRSELTRLALVSAVRWFLLWNCLQPKMRWILRGSKCVIFSHGAGVYEGGIGRRLLEFL